ncbi:dephospho-CoA kinase [Arsenicitalea aurantiaca]|uniref:Dephospho-CoA kinase n=1 Tax=Arsenicitalea aurantiaca TaxID=1783274 RepID=A0A433X8K5_9HYPH|nr:dephospho-CoA kinase [Arsenicitalea aurantiaca]RUT30421.1 dephospho-CoA kinase [Arsenicitalea aurantiaca]
MLLGLTGSIATGKSTALAAFAAHGVPVFSADDAVHALYRDRAVPAIESLFPGTTGPEGVDRAALSRALLADPDKLPALEAIVHPMVREAMAAFVKAARERGEPLVVLDIPLLFETGFDYGLDRVVVIHADPEVQRARALARPGMSVEKLEAILARQMPQAEKMARAHELLDGSGSIAALEAEVGALIARLTRG